MQICRFKKSAAAATAGKRLSVCIRTTCYKLFPLSPAFVVGCPSVARREAAASRNQRIPSLKQRSKVIGNDRQKEAEREREQLEGISSQSGL